MGKRANADVRCAMAGAAVLLNLESSKQLPTNIGAVCALGSMYFALKIKQKRKRAESQRVRMNWETFRGTTLGTEKNFRRYLRVSSIVFDEILQGIMPDEAKRKRAERAAQSSAGLSDKASEDEKLRHGAIGYELRLAMTLRYMAGASYLDLCALFGVGHSTFYNIIWKTLQAIDKYMAELTLEADIQNIDRCRTLTQRFAERSEHMKGCIGALDGMSLKIEAPSRCDNPLKFFCRKHFYAVSMQAICDADRRFLYFSMRAAGSVHDSLAWSVAESKSGNYMADDMAGSDVLKAGCVTLAPYGFFVVGDDAYKCCRTVLAPWTSAPPAART
jgi:hypothetical protein